MSLIQQTRHIYNLAQWSGGYFDVSEAGHLVAIPKHRPDSNAIDLYGLAQEIREAGLSWPVLVRFTDILHDRLDTLWQSFRRARELTGYEGEVTTVYPVKVNQQRHVVAEIAGHGVQRVGLEAGSKSELMMVLAMCPDNGVVICNGYKDREYIRLALIGRAMGLRVYIVIEKFSELELVIEESRSLGIEPLLGVRARLANINAGNWQNTGGERSKFGLSAAGMLSVIVRLKEARMLDHLRLLHVHLGSQIPALEDFRRGLREAARFYQELREHSVPIDTVDVGGGLGIDYEGTRSHSRCSMDYGVADYALCVVQTFQDLCTSGALPHPAIITECGRALTAHHAMLITNIIDTERKPVQDPPAPAAGEAPLIVALWGRLSGIEEVGATECFREATQLLAGVHELYNEGGLGLVHRAYAESLYYALCQRVRDVLAAHPQEHTGVLDELNVKLADKYFCNLSVFQSLPDVWALDQIFPVVPLHRLDQLPQRRAVLQDLTCDSDGHIEYYVDGAGVESTLPVHEVRPPEPYLLGIFLVGAYQEILGDMHNLFGDTDAVNVSLTGDGAYRLTDARRGDTAERLLRYVNFEPEMLRLKYRERLTRSAVGEWEQAGYLELLEAGLAGYTYHEE
jgi:arginine decarboxylase